MAFSNELLDQLLAGCERPEDILGPPGLFAQLKKAFAERALGAPSSGIPWLRKPKPHLPSAAGAAIIATAARPRRCSPTRGRSRSRSRAIGPAPSSPSSVPTISGPNHQRRRPGFEAKGLALSARGLTVGGMQAHLEERSGVAVSPELISTVTDAVLEEVTEWQQRPLVPLYPVIVFDALRLRIRDEGTVRAKPWTGPWGLPRMGPIEQKLERGPGVPAQATRWGRLWRRGAIVGGGASGVRLGCGGIELCLYRCGVPPLWRGARFLFAGTRAGRDEETSSRKYEPVRYWSGAHLEPRGW
jgi:putative transposase